MYAWMLHVAQRIDGIIITTLIQNSYLTLIKGTFNSWWQK